MSCVAVGPEADPGLEKLSSRAQGYMGSVGDPAGANSSLVDMVLTMRDAFYAATPQNQRPVQLSAKAVKANSPNATEFKVDPSLSGGKLKFFVNSVQPGREGRASVSVEGPPDSNTSYVCTPNFEMQAIVCR